MATSERVHAGVQAVVRHAITQGWLTGEQLREALLLQEQLRASGQPVELLPILSSRYLRPEHVAVLTQVYRATVPGDTLPAPAAVADVSREVLERSSELARRPRAEDPPRVRDFLRQSGQGDDVVIDNTLADRSTRPSERARAPDRIGGYRLVRELARGGMGVVYHAHSLSLDRPVALKVMRDALAPDPEDVERFLLEARAAARLRHPGIVGVHEVGQDEGRWFIAMDLVEGESLKARVTREGPLPGREAARIALGLARALAYAHERSILHRDVKPANVLIAKDGAPLLTDFGLAKDVGAGREERGLTATGMAVGTPAYMPPEQAEGDASRVDRRADVYGAGATLFEMLAGRAPFGGKTALSVLEAVINEAPPRPSSLRPGLDRDLETICLTCLEKDPARRYASAEALADDLEAYLAHRPIRARPVGPLGRVARWGKRNPLAAGALVVVALLALIGGVGTWAWRAGLERARREDETARRAALEQALAREDAGDPAADLVQAAMREPPALVVEVFGRRLDALTADLRRVAREVYLEAAALDAPERAAGATPLEGLDAAASAWTERACGVDVVAAHAATLRLAEERLRLRAARGDQLAKPSFAELVADRQSALGPRLRGADRLSEALARAGGDAALASVERYLDSLFDPARAFTPARVLCDADPDRGQEAALRALRRLGEHSPFAGPLKRLLEQVHADVRLVGEGAAAHAARARARLDKDDAAGAIEDATRAIELDAKLALAWRVRARARLRARDRDGALEDAARAVALAPDEEEAWLALGAARAALHDRAGALEALDRAVELAPDSAWAHRARARARLARDPEGARADADRAVALAPNDPRTRFERAAARHATGDQPGALEDLAAALAIDPSHPGAIALRGSIRQRMGQLEEAFADLTRAIDLAPDEWVVTSGALANRALIKHDRGDLAGAQRDVDAALRLDPDLAMALMMRARLVVSRGGDLATARADLDRAVELAPDDADVLANRASLRAAQDDAVGALVDLDRAVRLDPRSLVARVQRGKVRLSIGDHAGARADLEEATRLDERSVPAWRLLASAHAARGDMAERDRCLRQALALGPQDAEAAYELAQSRLEQGDAVGAERHLDLALERGEHVQARVLRGNVRLQRGRFAEAQADFERALTVDPTLLEAWVGLSLARRLQGDLAGGEEVLARAGRAGLDLSALLEERAEWRANLGDFAGCVEDADRGLAIGTVTPRPRLLLLRGVGLQALGELEASVSAYERFLALAPDADEAGQVRAIVERYRAARPAR